MGKVVAWPWLGVRWWGDCSKRPPCRGGAQCLPGDLSWHGPFRKKGVLFCIQARKMQVLLSDLMEVLQKGDEHIKTKALVVIQNIMGRLKKREASSVAVQLAEKLLPLFDEVRLMGQPESPQMGTGQGQLPFSPALRAALGAASSPLLSAPGSCGMASGFAAQPSFSLAAVPRARGLPSCTAGQEQTFSPVPKARG